MNRGLSMADVARAAEPALPALTHVEDLSADGKPIELTGATRIPSGRQRIALGYTGLSLSVPERIKFRYRLDGFDRDWSEAVTDRRAEYTNLGPGPYQFRVMASNSDGLWNGDEASIRFEIEPRFWQTVWFRLSALMLCVMIGWSVYRLRVMQVARQLNVRFEERLAERTRIAQELHDTLLQGFMSASMQLHVAADGLPQDSPARTSLSRVLDLMSRVIEEGRNAVRGLRSSSSSSHDLEQALSRVSEELQIGDQIDYRVIVDGHPRALNPIIRDEVYRIGREALANAVRHSGAKAIEVELEYASTDLRMLVRDNGCGIDSRVLRSGSEGHWGLSGMRERAERIGARFRVLSRDNAGTEIELTVPASVAFIRHSHGRRQAWAAGLFRFGRRRRRDERMEKDS
jgi:signal transduction histidine kinase